MQNMATPEITKPVPYAVQAAAKPTGIDITAAAAEEIAKQRAKRGKPESSIRVGLRGGGCTGFSYVFEWADEPRPTDKKFEQHGVSIVVDKRSSMYLGGVQVDFHDDLHRSGFSVSNPNAKTTCGCGSSFSM